MVVLHQNLPMKIMLEKTFVLNVIITPSHPLLVKTRGFVQQGVVVPTIPMFLYYHCLCCNIDVENTSC